MGMTEIQLIIKNPTEPKKSVAAKFLIDSGAHYTVLRYEIVQKLGLKPSYTQEFSMADGKTIKRQIGGAVVTFEGKELPVAVILGQKGDAALLGVTTLESFGLMLDPFKRRIYHSKLMLA